MENTASLQRGLPPWSWKSVPFVGVHVAAFAMPFVVPFSWGLVLLALSFYWLRMFAVTAAFHRYLTHRTFKTSRVFQFILVFIACTSLQKGPLWWAAHHRRHHRLSDQEGDVHSPVQQGFQYLPVWRSSEALWLYAVAQDANTHSYNYLGLTYFTMGQIDSAEFYYKKSIALEPGAITAIYNLGKVYEERKDDAKAEQTYRTVLGYDSSHFGSNNNLGNVLLRRGAYHEALAAYAHAIASEPDYPYSYYNTALPHERLGERDRAIEWYV